METNVLIVSANDIDWKRNKRNKRPNLWAVISFSVSEATDVSEERIVFIFRAEPEISKKQAAR
jgi:hypothetical protein